MNTTTYTGVIKDLTGAVVTSGEVIFTLTPAVDSTLSGVARFVPTKQSFPISGTGTINAVVMKNTAITPPGTCYRIEIRPYYASGGAVLFDFATSDTKDISTVTPTPATGPIDYSTATFTATASPVAAGLPPTVAVSSGGGSYDFAFGIPPGTAGPAATITVGTTTTGASGTQATVSNGGTSSAVVLDFTLPSGPATVAVASVTTLSAGSNATVTDTGTSGAAELNFGIPAGPPGTIGRTTAATSISQYPNTNPSGLASGSAFNPGLTVFSNGTDYMGQDITQAYYGSFNGYFYRMFTSSNFAFARGFFADGTDPTPSSAFNAVEVLTTQRWVLFPDSTQNNPTAIITSDGSLTLANAITAGGPVSAAGIVKGASFSTGSSASTSAINGTYTNYRDSANWFGNTWLNDSTYGFVNLTFAANNGSMAEGFHVNGTAPTGPASFSTLSRLTTPTRTYTYPPRNATPVATAPGWDSAGNFYATQFHGSFTTPLGSPFATSDAIAGNNATTLAQVQSYGVSRNHVSTSRGMLWTGINQYDFGDSITAGFEVNPGQEYAYLLAQAIGSVYNNRANSGDQTSDCALRVFSALNLDSSHRALTTVAVGTNDIYQNASAPSTAQEALFNLGHRAIIAWLGTRKDARVDGNSVSATNWANDTTFTAVTGSQSSTNGAAITYSLVTTGGPIYMWYRLVSGSGGTFTAVVKQGGTTINTLNLTTAGPATIATVNGGSTGVGVARVVVPAGTYTVTYTVTSTTGSGNTVSIVSTGTPSAHTYFTSPTVVVGGILPFQADAAGPYTAAFTLDIIANVQMFQGDGLDVRYADNRAVMQDGAIALYSNVGDLHPNAAGHALIAGPFIQASVLPPDGSVNRATPLSSAGPGTPEDVWAFGGYVYAVQNDRTIQRCSTLTF